MSRSCWGPIFKNVKCKGLIFLLLLFCICLSPTASIVTEKIAGFLWMRRSSQLQPSPRMDRTGEENLKDALARCDELDHMKGKFVARKTKDVSPRIAELQKSFGFAPGEPVTPRNFQFLIPAAKDIQRIMGISRRHRLMENVQGMKNQNQTRLVPYFKVQKANHQPYERVTNSTPDVRRKQFGFNNSMVNQHASNSNMVTSASNSRSDFSMSFDASYLNRSVPRSNNVSAPNLRNNCSFSNLNNFETVGDYGKQKLNKEADVSNITKHCGVLNSNKEFGGSNSNKALIVSSSKRDCNALKRRTDPRTVNRDFASRISNEEIDFPNSSMDFRKRIFRNLKYNYGF